MFKLKSVVVLCALIAAGCQTKVPEEKKVLHDEDYELYWYQRGAETTKAIWQAYRFRDDNSLLRKDAEHPLDFWFSAQAFDVLLDNVATFWRKDLAVEAVQAYFNDFTNLHPDRKANIYNDDILWWTIACTRAARITADPRYLAEARDLYDHLWKTQVDNALGGGMWWRSDEHKSKNACVNFPAVIAALNLYNATKDVKYLVQGQKIYSWAASKLFDPATGRVNDNVTVDGELMDWDFSYNAGTFIGASLRLYRATASRAYLQNAIKAGDHLTGALSEHGIIKTLGKGDLGAFNGIGARYLAELARRSECQRFRDYLIANARSAWTSRRLSDGINGPDWTSAPEEGEAVEAQTAVSAAMLYFAASRVLR